jgi:hypothetical protein
VIDVRVRALATGTPKAKAQIIATVGSVKGSTVSIDFEAEAPQEVNTSPFRT